MAARSVMFEKGDKIPDIHAAVAHILAGGWVYHHDKLLHPKWMANWSISLLRVQIQYGGLFYAFRKVAP